MPSTRARNAQQRAERKEKLLSAALKQFYQNGYAQTTVAMITAEANLSTGTFYLYFKSKIEVFVILYNQGIDVLRAMLKDSLSMNGSTYEKLLRFGEAYKQFYRNHHDYFRVLAVLHINQDDFHNPARPLLQETEANARNLLKIIEDLLQAGIDKGELKPFQVKETTTFLWGMMDGLLILEERGNLDFMGTTFEKLLEQSLLIIGVGLVNNT